MVEELLKFNILKPSQIDSIFINVWLSLIHHGWRQLWNLTFWLNFYHIISSWLKKVLKFSINFYYTVLSCCHYFTMVEEIFEICYSDFLQIGSILRVLFHHCFTIITIMAQSDILKYMFSINKSVKMVDIDIEPPPRLTVRRHFSTFFDKLQHVSPFFDKQQHFSFFLWQTATFLDKRRHFSTMSAFFDRTETFFDICNIFRHSKMSQMSKRCRHTVRKLESKSKNFKILSK